MARVDRAQRSGAIYRKGAYREIHRANPRTDGSTWARIGAKLVGYYRTSMPDRFDLLGTCAVSSRNSVTCIRDRPRMCSGGTSPRANRPAFRTGGNGPRPLGACFPQLD